MPDAKLPYSHGTPCWLDLFADDQHAAIAFYHNLFGWVGQPNPEFGAYAVLSTDGRRAVAGIAPKMPDQPPRPVTWNTYFTSDDVVHTAEMITKHGGTVLVGPEDVPGTGRMVFATDPAGAPFGLWQAGPFPGFQVTGEPGCAAWFELETSQGAASAEFYASVFGIEAQQQPEMPGGYWLLTTGGAQVAGIWQDPDARSASARAPRWNPYFQVSDTDATVATAIAAGAGTAAPAKDSPYGRFAKLRDPQGAEFSVLGPAAR